MRRIFNLILVGNTSENIISKIVNIETPVVSTG